MTRKIFSALSILFIGIALHSCTANTSKTEIKVNTDDTNLVNVLVVDVRTVEEWNNDGHADCSENIPINDLENNIEKLKQYDKIVLVCRSGNRAGIGKDMLESKGFQNVENAGAWQNIVCK